MTRRNLAAILCLFGCSQMCPGQTAPTEASVRSAIRKAATFFHDEIAVQGGYVYHYSLDLSQRWGEGLAAPEEIWVQPPGTPTVGLAYLAAYEATSDDYYLGPAREAAEALVYGQLRSGGWSNSIDCEGRGENRRYSGGARRRKGNSSLDDGQTQSAIQLVMRVDKALGFKPGEIHQCALRALTALLAAQFPNGGFPQVWTGPVTKQPVVRAGYPTHEWRTEGRIKNYWDMYTLNDNVCGYVADTLIDAFEIYHDDQYREALLRLGDFLILAQMPEPQPGWAQQYNYKMQPIWARKFEPPGISGDESEEVIATLLKIHAATKASRFLEPIPAALAYLKRSLLPDNELARFYELKTNRPLYMVRKGQQYELTYDDKALPKHYAFKTRSRIAALEKAYQAAKQTSAAPQETEPPSESEVREVMRALDAQGRWVTRYQGERLVGQPKFALDSGYISSATFSRNLRILCDYLAETGTD